MLHSSCALCSQPAAAAVNLGPLLGPIRDAKNPAADELFVHRLCALWSPEVCAHPGRCSLPWSVVHRGAMTAAIPSPSVLLCFPQPGPSTHPAPNFAAPALLPPLQVFETNHGTLRNVLAAIKRGRLMKCSHCGRRGATLGCRVPSCTCRRAWAAGRACRAPLLRCAILVCKPCTPACFPAQRQPPMPVFAPLQWPLQVTCPRHPPPSSSTDCIARLTLHPTPRPPTPLTPPPPAPTPHTRTRTLQLPRGLRQGCWGHLLLRAVPGGLPRPRAPVQGRGAPADAVRGAGLQVSRRRVATLSECFGFCGDGVGAPCGRGPAPWLGASTHPPRAALAAIPSHLPWLCLAGARPSLRTARQLQLGLGGC